MADPVTWRFDPFTESYSAVKQEDEDQAVPGSPPYRVRLNEVPRDDSPSTVEAVILVQLNEALDDSETGVDIVAGHYGRVNVNDIILVDDEQMQVTAKPGSPTLTVTRGYGGTTPDTHSTSAWMEILNSLTEITSGSPASREFRVDYKYNTGLVLFNSAESGYDVRFNYYGLGSPFHAEILWPTANIKDLAVTTAKLDDLGVTTGKIGNQNVTWDKIDTTEGTTGGGAGNHTLPGGSHGLYPRIYTAGSVTREFYIAVGFSTSGSYIANIYFSGADQLAKQYYIQSSPPYMLGSKRWGHFLFLLRKLSNGEIVSGYEAPDPPWAYNGSEWNPKDSPERISEIPHPFVDYYRKDPSADGLEIVLIDLREYDVEQWKKDLQPKKKGSILEDLAGNVNPPIGKSGLVTNIDIPMIERFSNTVKIKKRM